MWKPPTSFAIYEEGQSDNPCEEEGGQQHGNEEEEEEDDYMSDAFLSQCGSSKQDIRPGMPMSYSKQRALKLEKQKEERRAEQTALRNKKVTQQQRMDEGLSTAIGQDNKGFSMLQKMGYKPGTSLGKEGSGRVEPIRVEVKLGRGGLGLKEMLMERRREKERRYLAKIRRQNQAFDPNKYREQKRQEMQAKQMEADLRKCQRTCHTLDSGQEITEPMDWYFWPSYLLPEEEREEDDAEDTEGEPDDPDSASDNKSKDGDGDDDTRKGSDDRAQKIEEDHWGDEDEDNPVPPCWGDQEQLEPWQVEIQVDVVNTYLRTAYYYCVWCGTAYEDQEDLDKSCPGTTRQDHDD